VGDSTGVVQLGHVEVVSGALAEGGSDLVGALAPFDPLEVRRVRELFDGLPRDAWRVVADGPALTGGFGRQVLLAAPHAGETHGWALISLSLRDGHWLAGVDPGPVGVRPPKAVRREALRLVWLEQPIIGLVGELLCLKAGLQNVSDRPWAARDANDTVGDIDHLHVVAWLHDQNGKQLPARRWVSFGHLDAPESIASGETVMLWADVLTTDVDQLPQGEYGVIAMVTSLDLRSECGIVRLLTPDGTTNPTYRRS
jgi:hypothetical protein